MEQSIESRLENARSGSAASWAAIFAGAMVAAAVSLVLFALGTGLGFAAISPWPGHGVTATTFAITTAIWLIVMQWASSLFGGYITGRLRTRWIGTHTHEVFFRDTAHGFVTWAVATVLVAAIAATSAFSAIEGGAHAVAGAASGAAQVDKLFRSAGGGAANGQTSSDPRLEAAHIVANAWSSGGVPDADRTYLAELVAARSGISQTDAQKRVDEFITSAQDTETKAKAGADKARKAAAEAAIYMALSMLVGAFIASVAAALGGRLRDEHP